MRSCTKPCRVALVQMSACPPFPVGIACRDHVQEPILALRRQLALLTGAEAEAGRCFLAHAKLCRAGGHFQAALTATLEALARDVPGAAIQHTKLLWDMNEPHRAISQLQQVQRHAVA